MLLTQAFTAHTRLRHVKPAASSNVNLLEEVPGHNLGVQSLAVSARNRKSKKELCAPCSCCCAP